MPAIKYKVWRWGEPTSDGTCEQYIVAVQTRAKRGTDDTSRYAVANELVCAQLAAAIGLPVPVGAIVERDGVPFYASLDFNIEGASLPPADPLALALDVPDIACGIVLFDSWVCNEDRHDRNLHYNPKKRAVFVFDHSHAFCFPDGRPHLESMEDKLGLKNHCLTDHLTSFSTIYDWWGRIEQIPDYFIRRVINEGVHVGLPVADISYFGDFLIERRKKLLGLVQQNLGVFPNAAPMLWRQQGQDLEDYCI